jgi:hypothetical protein
VECRLLQRPFLSFNGAVWPPPGSNGFLSGDDADAYAVLNILANSQFSGAADPILVYALAMSEAAASAAGGVFGQQLQTFLINFDAAYDYSRFVSDPAAFDAALAATGDMSQFQQWQTEYALAQTMGFDTLTVTANNQLIISDTSANVLAKATALNQLVASGTLASVSFTDSNLGLSLTTAQRSSLSALLGKVTTPYALTVQADANTNETITGVPNASNTVSFASETQGMTANLSNGTATTVHTNPTSGGSPPFIDIVIVVSPGSPTTNLHL